MANRRQSARRRRADVETRARRAAGALARLVRVMAILRSPEGCPWDRKQTTASLRPFLLAETYEALDAIDRGDLEGLRDELGDVLFQCVFHAQIAAEERRFEIADAVNAITQKLIRRHPHVFTPRGRPIARTHALRRRISTPKAVKEQWARLKADEQSDAGERRRILAGVPRSLPALLRAHEIGTRVAHVGFDWIRAADVVAKIEEEVGELRDALTATPSRAAEELGDLLFSLANLARKLGIEPESALRIANDKFTDRFNALEASFERTGRSVHDASLDDMEAAWQRIKKAPAERPSSSARRARSARAPSARRSRR